MISSEQNQAMKGDKHEINTPSNTEYDKSSRH